MSINSFESFETYVQGAEQDQEGDGDLPTYDDLAAQHSPNSRCVQQQTPVASPQSSIYVQIWPMEGMDREKVRGFNAASLRY